MNLKKPHRHYHYERFESWYEKYGTKGNYNTDSQTFSDLDLMDFIKGMDYTRTQPGSYAFMDILRNPLSGRRDKNLETINAFKNNRDLKHKTVDILGECGPEITADYIQSIEGLRNFSWIFLPFMFTAMGVILISFVILIISGKGEALIYGVLPGLIAGTILQGLINKNISVNKKGLVEGIDFEITSLAALGRIVTAAGKLGSIDSPVFNDLKKSLDEVPGLKRSFRFFMMINSNDIVSTLSTYLLLKQAVYFFTVRNIKSRISDAVGLTKEFGRIDALLSFLEVTEELKADGVPLCEAKFTEKVKHLEFKNLIHPLIIGCVGNDLILSSKGAVLTGSNMSGKSTFLKACAISALTSETFGIAFADEFISSQFNIMTSMSPEEDISGKKSYFLSEAEAVKRLMDSLNEEVSGLYIIDEIFRGTNPEERIASSAKIIDYINMENALLLVSTHDLDMIKELTTHPVNYHFGGVIKDNTIYFPYKLEKGISSGTNAIKVLEMIGYPKKVTDDALKLVEKLKKEREVRPFT